LYNSLKVRGGTVLVYTLIETHVTTFQEKMEALAGVNARRAVQNQFVATYHKAVAQILEQLDNMEEETRLVVLFT